MRLIFTRCNQYSLLVLATLLSAVAYIYFDIAKIPFYLDDFSSIVNNPVIQQPIDFSQIWTFYKARIVTYSGFSIQLTLFGKEAASFHLFGLTLHLLVGILIFLFINLLDKTLSSVRKFMLAISITSVFLLHPQNSQAVVYIAQQAALWASLFYVSSLIFYILWRLESNLTKKKCLLGLCLFTSCCALLSKQTAATLPLAILLVEWLFFGLMIRRLISLGSVTLLVCLVYVYASQDLCWVDTLSYLDSISRETREISRGDYFANQTLILWHYIEQYFTLQGFRLEYDFLIVESWQPTQWFALVGHCTVLALSLLLKRFSPLITFGILFYYIAHLIESSFFPIRDLVFEHRTYLPNIGLTIAFVTSVYVLIEMLSYKLPRALKLYAGAAVIILSVVVIYLLIDNSHKRVEQWTDYLVFYKNEIIHSPKSGRATGEYATALAKMGDCPLAIGYYSHAIALYELRHKSAIGIQPEMLIDYIRCLRILRVYSKANKWELTLLEQVTEPTRRTKILGQRGQFYIEQKDFLTANEALTEAVSINNRDYALVMNLAISRVNLGQKESGRMLLKQALIIRPDDKTANHLLTLLNPK